MPLRVMIAEDDALARIGLSSILRDQAPAIELVGAADNGRDALALVLRLQPDVLITDVKMPVMDGIELLREIRRRELPIRVLLISAYTDFAYVREGMRLGAEDYLLKLELEDDKLIALLKRMGAGPSLPRPWGASPAEARAQCARQVLTGAYADAGAIARALEQAGIAMAERDLVVVAAQRMGSATGGPPAGDGALLHAFFQYLSDYGQAACCALERDLLAGFVSLRDRASRARLEAGAGSYIKNVLGEQLTVRTAGPAQRYEALPGLMNTLAQLDGWRYVLSPTPPSGDQGVDSYLPALDDLRRQIDRGSPAGIQSAMEALTKALQSGGVAEPKVLHSLCYTILYFVDHCVEEGKLSRQGWNRSQELMALIAGCKRPEDYFAYLNALSQRLEGLCPSEGHRAIDQAKAYMAAHYAQDGLSLEMVAAHVGLTPAYLSRLFSQKCDKSFVDYLTALRIDRAKKLLAHSNAQVQQVGAQVGYPNPYYFSRLFKKSTGLTPLDYRARHSG